jgi:ribonucleoside-diphosphate reductase alpha chain
MGKKMGVYESFIHKSRYARYLWEEGRRETWEETVLRYVNFWKDKGMINDKEGIEIANAIENLEVMPSMRSLMTAGPALDRDNMAGFNCSYIAVDHIRVFDEILYVLMCGTGVGFSVERQSVSKLPEVGESFEETDTVIKVADSKKGWAKAFKELISLLYAGQIPQWDLSKIREKGAPLKTFGGRSSGPDPLDALFSFTVSVFRAAAGRKLNSLECHDIVCKTAEVVVVGGVRRSALISLSNLSDDRMRGAKQGQWWETTGHRALANNSAVYTEQPDFEVFLKEMLALHESKAGERGIFSRLASKKQAERNGRRDINHDFGTNPCSEIILRSAQVCNLSEVVVRSTDTFEDLNRKVRVAAILGTLQSTLTDFDYVRAVWKRNTEEERLLGVSLTGIMDHAILSGKETKGTAFDHPNQPDLAKTLEKLKQTAVDTNKEWAEKLGIEQSTAITCVKPSGTVSQLVDSASGIHARFSDYYIRRVRNDLKDPVTAFLIEAGVPWEQDVMNPETVVFSFPMKAPDGAVTVDEQTALSQLELWEVYQDSWCEHKPSVTVYYSDDEFLSIGQWIWDKLDKCSGVSLLPRTDHVYSQAPYESIDRDTYEELSKEMPTELDWSILDGMENGDNTVGAQTLACSSATGCEI